MVSVKNDFLSPAYEIRKLSNHSNAQAYVAYSPSENALCLVSYNTKVAYIFNDPDGRKIACTGTYSATTRKHITYFLREYAPDLSYYDMKNIVGKGLVAC